MHPHPQGRIAHHNIVSQLLRYSVEAWISGGDMFLREDLRVHARARMGSGQTLIRVKVPLRDTMDTQHDVQTLLLFDAHDNTDFRNVVTGEMVTCSWFHTRCVEHILETERDGLLWYIVRENDRGGKTCTGGLTMWRTDDRLVIVDFITACDSHTESVLWLYLINLCDTRNYDISVTDPCSSPCIRWPLITSGFLRENEEERIGEMSRDDGMGGEFTPPISQYRRICTHRLLTEEHATFKIVLRQISQFMLTIIDKATDQTDKRQKKTM